MVASVASLQMPEFDINMYGRLIGNFNKTLILCSCKYKEIIVWLYSLLYSFASKQIKETLQVACIILEIFIAHVLLRLWNFNSCYFALTQIIKLKVSPTIIARKLQESIDYACKYGTFFFCPYMSTGFSLRLLYYHSIRIQRFLSVSVTV